METLAFGKTGMEITPIGFGSWGIGGNAWGPQDDEEADELVRRYTEVRDIIQEGDQCRLLSSGKGKPRPHSTSPRTAGLPWSSCFATRICSWTPPRRSTPRALEEGPIYRVTDLEEPQSGGALMGRGIEVALEEDLTSVMIGLTQT